LVSFLHWSLDSLHSARFGFFSLDSLTHVGIISVSDFATCGVFSFFSSLGLATRSILGVPILLFLDPVLIFMGDLIGDERDSTVESVFCKLNSFSYTKNPTFLLLCHPRVCGDPGSLNLSHYFLAKSNIDLLYLFFTLLVPNESTFLKKYQKLCFPTSSWYLYQLNFLNYKNSSRWSSNSL
jgi:hypothetical protein